MNILVFSWRDPKHPLAGGAEQSMHEHMKGWVDAGNTVTLFSSLSNDNKANETIDGIQIIRQGSQYLGVQFKAFLYYLSNKNKYNFVVDQFHGIPFFTPLYVTKPKLAVLQEVTKEVWFKNPLVFPLNLIVGFLGFITEPFIFLFYKNTKFMVGSNSAKEDLIKFGIKDTNITIVPHGVILPNKIPSHKITKHKIITFLGTLSEDKGIPDALKTFKVLSHHSDYKFWIIGKFESQKYFKKIKSELGDINVKFWGRVDNDKKFMLLSKSFLLINPSIREGWGLVNIEANVVGIPVIAYPSQGLVDSVKDGLSGILTKNSTPEDLALEIEKLVKDKIRYKKLSNGSRKWASNFTWDKSRKLSLNLIHV